MTYPATKPLVLLDVDGVINQYRLHGSRAEVLEFIVDGYGITVSHEVAQFLPLLVERAEVVWLTTWRSRANEIGRLLGLPSLPAMDDGGWGRTTSWKWPTAQRRVLAEIASGRRVMWIEDFAGNPHQALAQAAGVETVDTTPARGLVTADIERIERWLDG
jgi:hypothetical protein